MSNGNVIPCDTIGHHNPRYYNDSESICLGCGKFINNLNLTNKEVSIVDFYRMNPRKDKYLIDYEEE